jgi:hypothetical protein
VKARGPSKGDGGAGGLLTSCDGTTGAAVSLVYGPIPGAISRWGVNVHES